MDIQMDNMHHKDKEESILISKIIKINTLNYLDVNGIDELWEYLLLLPMVY